jgi:hypothetical protein
MEIIKWLGNPFLPGLEICRKGHHMEFLRTAAYIALVFFTFMATYYVAQI